MQVYYQNNHRLNTECVISKTVNGIVDRKDTANMSLWLLRVDFSQKI